MRNRVLDMLLLLLLLCVLRAQTAEAQTGESQTDESQTGEPQTGWTQPNVTSNASSPVNEWFSGRFGFSNLAGKRSFLQNQEMQNRIVGGQEALAHSWPWQISLRFSSTPACGGAIIGPLWVVTAAHCFRRFNKASLWTVLAGKHNLDNPEESGQQMVELSSINIHSSYSSQTKDGDVALLRLRQPLLFNRFVRPIDLWMDPLPSFSRCTVTGWGTTRENGPRVYRLQEVNVTVLPPEDCERYYNGRVRPSMICAGREQGGVDACQGDSGGPLSCFNGLKHKLAGVVSWGIGCGRARRPGVYSLMQQYAQWISDTMDDQDFVDSNSTTDEEDTCGQKQTCMQTPSPADIWLSQDGKWSVRNVSEACPYSWPWMVSLQSNGRHYCSGVLIHPHWVITARHCNVRAGVDVVVLGVHNLHLSTQSVLVKDVFTPHHASGFPPKDDLSLVRLNVAARLGPRVSLVCIPEEDEDLDQSWSCVCAGWGSVKSADDMKHDVLHQAGLKLVNQSSCTHQWGGFITDNHLCCNPAGAISCMGDSGTPLFCQKRGVYFLFAVASWGNWQCDGERAAVFTRVSDYESWINSVINSDGNKLL